MLKYLCRFLWIIIFFTSTHASAQECPIPTSSLFPKPLPDQLSYLPNYGCLRDTQFAGYLPITSKPCKQKYCHDQPALFYWFVGSQANMRRDPIVLWLNGGPGASSFYGFFAENGPYIIDKQGNLQQRTFAWTRKTNFLIIDNPLGVGYSYSPSSLPYHNENDVIEQLYNALVAFYKRYPELQHNPLYLAGESYAGKYLPELATYMLQQHSHIPLRGLLVGDGWVDPLTQQATVADYAYSHGLIDQRIYKKTKAIYQKCAQKIVAGKYREANQVCEKMGELIAKASGVSRTNINTLSEIDYLPIVRYLNLASVRRVLHVNPKLAKFKLFSDKSSEALAADIQKSALSLYEILLNAGIPVLVFNGLDDGKDCNFMGINLWLDKLNWRHKNTFDRANTCIWRDANNDINGYVRSGGGLTQVNLRKAGHMAVLDQPQATQDMLHRFIAKENFCLN